MYESDLFVNVLYTRCKYNVQALVFRLHYGLDCFVVVVFPTSLQCPTWYHILVKQYTRIGMHRLTLHFVGRREIYCGRKILQIVVNGNMFCCAVV